MKFLYEAGDFLQPDDPLSFLANAFSKDSENPFAEPQVLEGIGLVGALAEATSRALRDLSHSTPW